FFFSSRRRHTRLQGDWSSDVCSSDLGQQRSGITLSRVEYGRTEQETPKVARGTHCPCGAGCDIASVRPRLRDSPDARSASARAEIGRASCRERVEVLGGAGASKKKRQ